MTEGDTYLTLAAPAEGAYREKGSRFLAFAAPVRTEGEAKECLERLRKEYYDARHHCYAYVLGPAGAQYRANDAGEPNHSAGDPILGQIRSRGLTDVIVVVVRYFGGTKLGVSGLINAYRTAAAAALDAARVVQKTVRVGLSLHFVYPATNAVMKVVKEYDLDVTHQTFHTDCHLEVWVRRAHADEVTRKFGQAEVTVAQIKGDGRPEEGRPETGDRRPEEA
jgi:uncharacterized YigZ family protein